MFLLSFGALGSLERVDFRHPFRLAFYMGGKIAVAIAPFHSRIWAGLAVLAMGGGQGSIAVLARFHNGMASATVVGAPLRTHEKTFSTLFDGLTKHGLSLLLIAEIWITLLTLWRAGQKTCKRQF